MMRCSEARRVLRPVDAPRVGDDELARAIEHAEGCAECEAFLVESRRVSRLLRERVPRVPAPPELRERVTAALARERGREAAFTRPSAGGSVPWRRAAAWGTLVAASLALLVLSLAGGLGSDSTARAFTRDYLRRAVVEETLATDDPARMSAFFARELGQPIQPPRVTGYELDQAMVCRMDGRQVAVIEYRVGDDRIAYFIVPSQNAGDAERYESLDIRQIEAPHLSSLYGGGDQQRLTIAAWKDPDHDHALIGLGNVNPDRLRRILPIFGCPLSEA